MERYPRAHRVPLIKDPPLWTIDDNEGVYRAYRGNLADRLSVVALPDGTNQPVRFYRWPEIERLILSLSGEGHLDPSDRFVCDVCGEPVPGVLESDGWLCCSKCLDVLERLP